MYKDGPCHVNMLEGDKHTHIRKKFLRKGGEIR